MQHDAPKSDADAEQSLTFSLSQKRSPHYATLSAGCAHLGRNALAVDRPQPMTEGNAGNMSTLTIPNYWRKICTQSSVSAQSANISLSAPELQQLTSVKARPEQTSLEKWPRNITTVGGLERRWPGGFRC